MAAVNSQMVALGTAAPAFTLTSLHGETVALDDFADAPALLVVFLSNHCPYVRHIEDELGRFAVEYAQRGLATVGICANDVINFPDDDREGLREQARRAGFTFPYALDEEQQVAAAYHAACTPDFFLYDAARRLAYRGEFDESRPGNGQPVTGERLRAAADLVLVGRPVPEPHRASVGCSIKWKPGNEPA